MQLNWYISDHVHKCFKVPGCQLHFSFDLAAFITKTKKSMNISIKTIDYSFWKYIHVATYFIRRQRKVRLNWMFFFWAPLFNVSRDFKHPVIEFRKVHPRILSIRVCINIFHISYFGNQLFYTNEIAFVSLLLTL